MRKGTVVREFIFCLVLVMIVSGCERNESPVSADTGSSPTPTSEQSLVGSWYTDHRASAAVSQGYEFQSNGTVLRLVLDNQNLLEYDSATVPGQFSITSPGVCLMNFPSQTGTGKESWYYWLYQNDSVLALSKYPTEPGDDYLGGTFYVRKTIGKPAW
jgi:hypothetical protein